MSNPELLTAGIDPEKLDPIFGPDGTVYLKAAGDSFGVPDTASDPRAPQLVQVAGHPSTQHLVTPSGLALVEGTGTLGAATYYYRVSAITASGETLACAEVSLAIAATHGVDLTWDAVSGATGYRVYGRSTGAELLIAEVTAPLVTYTDAGSISPSGALPTVNTARFGQVAEPVRAGTSTRTSVNDNNADTLLLAANPLRKGAVVYNDSAEILYLAFGTVAASTTSFTYKVAAGGAVEVPFSYSGEIRGIWAANGSGAARVSELV